MRSAELSAALDLHPLIAEVLVRRGCDTPETARAFLDPAFYAPAPAADLPGMDRAVAELRAAIARRDHIRIWGDFDVDGQTASAVLLLGLRALGARVDFIIPNRATHSHGLNRDGVDQAAADGVRLLLTCDCGVTDFDEIAYARELGLTVVISDHHDLAHDASGAVRLPDAQAIVNPKQLPETHPLVNLPGVGVAYKLIEALNAPDAPDPSLLGLVALGIVADIADQRGDTRYLLQRGLAQLRDAPRPGIRALLRGMEQPALLDAETIGFYIGPRLNAAGRLATADLSVRLLTTDDAAEAEALADAIDQLNTDRRALQNQIESEALALIDADPSLARREVIVLHREGWNASVIGIVASTLVERFGKPGIVIAEKAGQLARASARSVAGIDIHKAIAAQGALTIGGGGHPMAAGFSIDSAHIPAFVDGVCAAVAAQRQAARDLQREPGEAEETFPVSWPECADAERAFALANQIERLAPFGAGNPRPLLNCDGVFFARAETIGKDGRHQAVYLTDGSNISARAVWWRSAHLPAPPAGVPLRVRFYLSRDLSRKRAQITLHSFAAQPAQDAHPSAEEAPDARSAAAFAVLDVRAQADWRARVEQAAAEHGAGALLTWPADAARPAHVLVLTQAPPGPDELNALLRLTQPQLVILTPQTTVNDAPEHVLARARALLRTAQQRGDSIDDAAVLARMAVRINQRPDTLRAAFGVLAGEPGADDKLAYLLAETAGYRKLFRDKPAERLLRSPA